MPWVPLDDNFHSHRKVVTAGLEAVGLHVRALSWVGANLTDGHIPTAVGRQFAGTRIHTLAQRLVDAGLWEVDDDGWRIHGWTERNPPSDLVRARRDAANDRQRRWRRSQSVQSAESAESARFSTNSAELAFSAQSARSNQSGSVTLDVTRYVTPPETHNVTPRPSPSPSPTPMEKSRPPLSLGDAHAGREDRESPGQDLFSAVRAARERAGRASTWWHDSALEVALEVASRSHPNLQPRELELCLLTIASWPDTKAPSRLVHVVEKALREATQGNGGRRRRREPEPLPPLPPSMAELRAKGALGNA